MQQTPTMTLEIITPDEAKMYLGNMAANRHVSQHRLGFIEADLKGGRWVLDGNPIRFNTDGKLIDGQHRLQAVVRSGVPIETYVVRGLSTEASETIDTGKSRNTSDVLAIKGYVNSTMLASLSRVVISYDRKSLVKVSTSDSLAFVECNPSVAECASYYNRIKDKRITREPSVIAALHFIANRDSGHKEESASFFNTVVTGQSERVGNPAIALRERLIHAMASDERLTMSELMSTVIYAHNIYVAGGTASRITVIKTRSPFEPLK